jgi:hypothetical protein
LNADKLYLFSSAAENDSGFKSVDITTLYGITLFDKNRGLNDLMQGFRVTDCLGDIDGEGQTTEIKLNKITIKGNTTNSNDFDSENPRIEFSNPDGSRRVQLLYNALSKTMNLIGDVDGIYFNDAEVLACVEQRINSYFTGGAYIDRANNYIKLNNGTLIHYGMFYARAPYPARYQITFEVPFFDRYYSSSFVSGRPTSSPPGYSVALAEKATTYVVAYIRPPVARMPIFTLIIYV